MSIARGDSAGETAKPESSSCPGITGRWSARNGFANPATLSETKYVVASKTPRPHGGRRDESEARNVPMPGNIGPDTDHHRRFRSRSGIVRSAVTPSSRRATLMSASVSGSKTPMSLIRARLRRSCPTSSRSRS